MSRCYQCQGHLGVCEQVLGVTISNSRERETKVAKDPVLKELSPNKGKQEGREDTVSFLCPSGIPRISPADRQFQGLCLLRVILSNCIVLF